MLWGKGMSTFWNVLTSSETVLNNEAYPESFLVDAVRVLGVMEPLVLSG